MEIFETFLTSLGCYNFTVKPNHHANLSNFAGQQLPPPLQPHMEMYPIHPHPLENNPVQVDTRQDGMHRCRNLRQAHTRVVPACKSPHQVQTTSMREACLTVKNLVVVVHPYGLDLMFTKLNMNSKQALAVTHQ